MGYPKHKTLDIDQAHVTNTTVFGVLLGYSIGALVAIVGGFGLIVYALSRAGS